MLLFEIRLSIPFSMLLKILKPKIASGHGWLDDSDRFRHVIRPFVRKFDLETDLQETIIVFRPRNQNQLCVQMMILAIVTKILKNTQKSTIYWMDWVRDDLGRS